MWILIAFASVAVAQDGDSPPPPPPPDIEQPPPPDRPLAIPGPPHGWPQVPPPTPQYVAPEPPPAPPPPPPEAEPEPKKPAKPLPKKKVRYRFSDAFLGVGGLLAPQLQVVDDSTRRRTIGLFRLYYMGAPRKGSALGTGFDIEAGGAQSLYYRARLRYLVGVNAASKAARAGFNLGIGYTLVAEEVGAITVPAHVSFGLPLGNSMAIHLRGGANYVFFADEDNPALWWPEGVASLSLGRRNGPSVNGLRVEVGWRREFSGDVYTLMVGLGG